MKHWIVGTVVAAMLALAVPSVAEAKRFGGSRSGGMQRDMPARTAPDTPPPRPANPAPTTPNNAGGAAAPAAAGTAAAASTARRSWMGPIAGLAAGLGLAALASALGFGEAFANFMMLALLALVVIGVIGFVMRRRAGSQPSMAGMPGAARGPAAGGAQVAWPAQAQAPVERRASPVAPGVSDPVPGLGPATAEPPEVAEAPAARAVPKAFVPAAFDSENFARTAKMIFIRMQAANDAADLDDLRRFTTPEFFASIRLDLQERGASENHTDVQRVDAEVLDVTNEADQQIVSVRFRGDIVEERGGQPQAFDEVWHLVKPLDDSRSWAIAGIEQMN